MSVKRTKGKSRRRRKMKRGEDRRSKRRRGRRGTHGGEIEERSKEESSAALDQPYKFRKSHIYLVIISFS